MKHKMTKEHEMRKERYERAANSPVFGPADVTALKAEASRLRAEAFGGALRRLVRGPRANAANAKTVEIRVRGNWYAPTIRSVLDKFSHQLDAQGGPKAANTDESNRAA
ncbi:MAG: hypothetical protein ACTSXZ_01615 [Alphaproteobacteria bacterium]